MLRRLMSFVLVLGVLTHAAALVRHNAVMLEAYSQRAQLIADLMVICHPSGAGTAAGATLDAVVIPDVPLPTDAQNNCPICSGLAFDVALAVPALTPHYLRFDPPEQRPTHVAASSEDVRFLLPPARGPPALA